LESCNDFDPGGAWACISRRAIIGRFGPVDFRFGRAVSRLVPLFSRSSLIDRPDNDKVSVEGYCAARMADHLVWPLTTACLKGISSATQPVLGLPITVPVADRCPKGWDHIAARMTRVSGGKRRVKVFER
jgi:hypothetical protein